MYDKVKGQTKMPEGELMKTQDVRNLIAQENYKAALCGAKEFRLGVTKEQRSIMSRAYESIVHPVFYKQIGIDTEQAIKEGIAVLRTVV
jgi:hypothetical protein